MSIDKISPQKKQQLVSQFRNISKKIIDRLVWTNAVLTNRNRCDLFESKTIPIIKELQSLENFFEDFKIYRLGNQKLIINNDSCQAIVRLINEVLLITKELENKDKVKSVMCITQSFLNIFEILQRDFMWIGDNITGIFDGPFISNQIVLLIANIRAQLKLDKFDSAELKLKLLKYNIDRYSILTKINYLDDLCTFYNLKALLFANRNMVREALIFLSKAESTNQHQEGKNRYTNSLVISENYSVLRNNLFTSQDFYAALSVSKKEFQYLNEECGYLQRAIQDGGESEYQSSPTILDSSLEELKKKLISIKKLVHYCQYQLLQNNINKILEMPLCFGVVKTDLFPSKKEEASKFSLEIQLNECVDINLISQYLVENNIAHKITGFTLFLHKFYKTDLKKLKAIIEVYDPQFNNHSLSSPSISPESTISSSISQPYTSSSPSPIPSANRLSPFELSDSSPQLSRSSMFTNTKSLPVSPKVIKFDEVHQYVSKDQSETSVYKLHGYAAHREYVYISPNLMNEIMNLENGNKILKYLQSVCERGKVINDRAGSKVFIQQIHPHTKRSNFKIKDDDKGYRFFSRLETSVAHNYLHHNLHVIDRFKVKSKDEKSATSSHDLFAGSRF